MSAMGQSRRFCPIRATSAFPPIATIKRTFPDVRFVPLADIAAYSITASAAQPARILKGAKPGDLLLFVTGEGCSTVVVRTSHCAEIDATAARPSVLA